VLALFLCRVTYNPIKQGGNHEKKGIDLEGYGTRPDINVGGGAGPLSQDCIYLLLIYDKNALIEEKKLTGTVCRCCSEVPEIHASSPSAPAFPVQTTIGIFLAVFLIYGS